MRSGQTGNTRLAFNPTLDRIEKELASLRARSLHRTLESMDGSNFCSNDYLALSKHPDLVSAVREAIVPGERVASTGSRLLSGHVDAWEEVEEEFADYVGAEASLFFNSGYAANIGVLTSILRDGDIVFSDSANHASLIDGMRLSRVRKVIFPHLNLDALEDALRNEGHGGNERFIVSESLFGMDGDQASVSHLHGLADRYGASLIIDEAHATGVLGKQGRGLVEDAGRPESVLATIHTCGKALASAGAFVACSKTLKDFLINRARTFVFSTSLPPYMAVQVRTALRIAKESETDRAGLAANARLLRDKIREAGLDCGGSESQIVPVMLGTSEDAVKIAAALNTSGFAVRAIRPPTVPAGTARLRLSLNVDIPPEIIHELVRGVVAAMGQVSQ
jgi:8-amino-7-oxononanoate synthase